MPIYEYQCGQCGHISEKLQSRTDPPPQTCPSCGAQGSLERIISQTSFHLKGGGWYVTDYKGKNPAGTTPAAEPAASGSTTEAASASTSADTSAAPASPAPPSTSAP